MESGEAYGEVSEEVSNPVDVLGSTVPVSVVGSTVPVSVLGISVEVSGNVVGISVVAAPSALHAIGNVDGQLESFGWKQASVREELVQ